MGNELKTENIYEALICDCQKQINEIRNKIGFITIIEEVAGVKAPVISETHLQRQLRELLNSLKELKEDITI